MNWIVWLVVSLFVIAAAIAWIILHLFRRWRRDLPNPPYRQPAQRPRPEEFSDDEVTVCWVGHSTVYINFYGIRILTDPVFSDRVGLSVLRLFTVGVKRHTAPALRPEDISGKVDVVLLSHAHMDHFDLPSLRKLQGPSTQVVTATGTGRLLRRFTFSAVTELGGRDRIQLDNGLAVTAVPVRHWGNRFPWNRGYGYTGYLISYRGVQVFFAGDTAYTPSFSDLKSVGPIDLALIPIGAYSPDAYQGNHCTPEQAWQMFEDSGARFLAPIHWDTFVLSDEPIDEPINRLQRVAPDEEQIVWRRHGDVFRLIPQQNG